MGASLGRDQSLQRQRDLVTDVRQAAGTRETVVVLPESTLGFWTPTLERFWRNELQGTHVTVVAGAAVVDAVGYDNVMVAIDAHGGRVLYRERMPVPVSMWRPWRAMDRRDWRRPRQPLGQSCRRGRGPKDRASYLLRAARRVAHSPVDATKPDAIVLIGNGWWTTGGNIVAIQRASAKAWSALFGVPL
jgi:hypothetical protein